jgi:two-component system sensor histidine kinase PilS (NtrC family)
MGQRDEAAHNDSERAAAGGRRSAAAVSTIRRRLAWLITARVAVSTALLGSAVLLQVRAPGSLPSDPFFLLIALTFALTVLYAVSRSYAERHAWLIALQLGLDAAAVSAFVFFTGGIASYFSPLYALPIIGASMLLSRRGGVWVALLSAALYGGVIAAQYLSAAGYLHPLWLGPAAVALPPRRIAEYTIVTNAFAFVAVAFLSGSLAEGLRTADRRLEQASIAIADLKALNQHILDSLTSGLATTDRTGRLWTFNRAAEAITGHAASAVIGRPADEVLQLPGEYAALFERDLDGWITRRADYTFRTGQGASKDIGLSTTHLITSNGRSGYLLTFQDVTELRRLEREARRQQRLAAVGEMAAGVAHEIRNPLASLRGSIQVLRQELKLDEEQGRLMDIVLRESERLNDTIRSLLTYARPSKQTTRRFEVGGVLRDVAALLRNSTEVHERHTIDVNTGPAEVWHEADEDQLRQIVWNLATNGLRAMPDGGRLVLAAGIDASHQSAGGGALVLRVEDEGVGIAPEDLDGIFQPFRGGFARGSGLGLAIVQRLVSDNGGDVQLESAPG